MPAVAVTRGRARRPVRVHRLELLFLGLGGVFSAIPGISALLVESWWPPEAQIFRVAPTVVGVGVLAAALLLRRRLVRYHRSRLLGQAAGAVAMGLTLLFAYSVALKRAVLEYVWTDTPERALVPYGLRSWAGDDLRGAIRVTGGPAPDEVSLENVKRVAENFGPAALDTLIPAGPTNLTVAFLLLLYSVCIGMIVYGFALVGVRLQAEGVSLGGVEAEDHEDDELEDGDAGEHEDDAGTGDHELGPGGADWQPGAGTGGDEVFVDRDRQPPD